MMIWAKLGWNGQIGSGEGYFEMLVTYFRYFAIISPLEKGMVLHLTKRYCSSSKYVLCYV